ncbi:peptidoglycan-binding domain-containing protein [Ketogulonicigenium vulgare]|uniref:Peptidoglycan-binding domain 1 n=1 Tax=Ketogulonicigenium vulgare (strain WSH-001) TaxID=759362 RepID=F9Y4C4_KETVW|nr:peptidoglycan-binding domain-containing protein [Ketogulonicigenium vulgare]AEM41737.1 Peptidoglycan-binding domain 1 [Ketogulonicigenium vulgare WSH-001]
MRHKIYLALATMLLPGAALANDAALLLGVERYETLGRVARGADVANANDGLTALGFRVAVLPNGRAEPTLTAVQTWLDTIPESERIVAVLSGRFVTDGSRTWFLTAEAGTPSLLGLGDTALSLESLLEVMAARQGRALLVLAPEAQGGAIDPYLYEGIGALDIPQGVSVVTGDPSAVAGFATEDLTQPGGDLLQLANRRGGLGWQGFVPRSGFVLMPLEAVPAGPPQPTAEQTAAEEALWQGAQALDSVEAYRNYLARYPMGIYAALAEEAIAAIVAEPNRADRMIEEAMNLTAAQRRTIQQNLQRLGFDPRGVDGIFGAGTRAAISAWQRGNDFPPTGYVASAQLTRLEAQAARRTAEAEAEAARQAQAAALADQDFWREIGAQGDAPGLRAYLERYPTGAYAAIATERLAAIDAEIQAAATARETSAWAAAEAANTPAAYQDYLQVYPQGRFAPEARARITAGTAPTPDAPPTVPPADDAAASAEAALNINAMTGRVVEDRLNALGFNPGTVDGVFDDETRAALRRYQEARGLPVTGYLDQQVLVRLLADTLIPGVGQ